MPKYVSYLLHHFLSSFLSLFGTLFFIVSIIFFIKMTKITSIVQVSFGELAKLFSFVLPEILLYTIPISFFIALSLSLFSLSKENESVVLFTLGISPMKISKVFGILSFLFSSLLMFNSLVLIPLSDQLSMNFLDYKKKEAKLNLQADTFGQKFGDWILLVGKSDEVNKEKSYQNVILYENSAKKDRFIISQKALVFNKPERLELNLQNGRAYEISIDNIEQIDYKTLVMYSKNDANIRQISSVIEYWSDIKTDKKKARHFTLYLLMSLFPIFTFLMAISFGIVTYRYQKGQIYTQLFIGVISYFALSVLASRYMPLFGILLCGVLFLTLSFFIYKKKILKVY